MGIYTEWQLFAKSKNLTKEFMENLAEEIENNVGADVYPPIKDSDEEWSLGFNTESWYAANRLDELLDKKTAESPIRFLAFEERDDREYFLTAYANGIRETVKGTIEYPEHQRVIY